LRQVLLFPRPALKHGQYEWGWREVSGTKMLASMRCGNNPLGYDFLNQERLPLIVEFFASGVECPMRQHRRAKRAKDEEAAK
jgi:hypothetical protein